jgi:hypothetical protein
LAPLGLNAASSGSIGAQSVGAVARGDVELGAVIAAVAGLNTADAVAALLCVSCLRGSAEGFRSGGEGAG